MDTDVILEQEFTVYGRKDLDQIDGKKYLVENHGIDAQKLGFMGVLMEVSSR
jgi:hypothetical protein